MRLRTTKYQQFQQLSNDALLSNLRLSIEKIYSRVKNGLLPRI
jgi:hypothetical protein